MSTSATHTLASSSTPSGGDPATTVTFAVNTGVLAMTAPATANLGLGTPGHTLSGQLGTVMVSDNRALLAAAWSVSASSTNFTTGGGTAAETVLASAFTYNAGGIVTTGVISPDEFIVVLSDTPQHIVDGTVGVGDNSATWNPTLSVEIPAAAVNGTYTGTLTQSVV